MPLPDTGAPAGINALASGGQQGFHLEVSGPRCLLLHGFTGSPAELFYLAARLGQDGFDVTVPCLPGHGADSASKAGAEEWIAAARSAAAAVAREGERFFLAGLSMGALLALDLAATRPEAVAALALLAPAVRLKGLGLAAARAVRCPWLQRRIPRLPKVGGSDLRDAAARRWNPTGTKVPTRGLAELDALGPQALGWAATVRCPTLVIVGALDRTIDNGAARTLAAALRPPAELLELPRSGHLVSLDRERGAVADAVIAHFRRATPSTAVAPGRPNG